MSDPEKEDRFDQLAEAFLKHAHMEEMADYASRGRRFSDLGANELQPRWEEAVRAWLRDRTPDRQRDMDDLAAEIRLRGGEPSTDALQAEMAAMQEELRRIGPDEENESINAQIRKFMQAREKPSS